jgi:hypothetical protein
MFISRYALAIVSVAVLSLLGLTQADTSSTRSAITPGTSTTFSAPNGVHVQMMKEASSAYPSKVSTGAGGRDNEAASCRQNAICHRERRRESAKCNEPTAGEPHQKGCGNGQSTDSAGSEK